MREIGIDYLTAMGIPPLEFIAIASELGCPTISLAMSQGSLNAWNRPFFNLITDAPLRREVRAALSDTGVRIAVGEGFLLMPDRDFARIADDQFDTMLELGVERLNCATLDSDLDRSFDQFAYLTERATAAGFSGVVCEFAPTMPTRSLADALDVQAHVSSERFSILIDTMHFGRTGGTAAELKAMSPGLLSYVQLCDAPIPAPSYDWEDDPAVSEERDGYSLQALLSAAPQDQRDYMFEAMTERMLPGDGDLPLLEYIRATPAEAIISVEVPQVSRAQSGESPRQFIGRVVGAARALIEAA